MSTTPLTAVTFSVEQDIKDEISRIAAAQRRSKSDVFRDMYRSYRFSTALDAVQTEGQTAALTLGLETDDDVIDYLKNRGKFAHNKHGGKT